MVERTAELRSEIEATRDRMTTTVDAIGDRVSPGRIAERRWARIRQATGSASQRVMGTPKQVAGTTRDRAGGVASTLSDSASGAATSLSDTAGSLGQSIGHAPDRIQETTQGNPLAVGAVAFGLGVLVGSLAPPSREETQVAEKVMEPLQQEAKAIGQEVASSVQGQAKEGLAQTKQVASDAAAQVKDHAQSAAQTVSSEAKDASSEVADQAKQSAQDVRSGPSSPQGSAGSTPLA